MYQLKCIILYDTVHGALTAKLSKMALNPFCDETLHLLFAGKWCLPCCD